MGSVRNSDLAKARRASPHRTDDPVGRKTNTETVTPSEAGPFATFSEWSGEADEKAYRNL
jgi:hypothetical protein